MKKFGLNYQNARNCVKQEMDNKWPLLSQSRFAPRVISRGEPEISPRDNQGNS